MYNELEERLSSGSLKGDSYLQNLYHGWRHMILQYGLNSPHGYANIIMRSKYCMSKSSNIQVWYFQAPTMYCSVNYITNMYTIIAQTSRIQKILQIVCQLCDFFEEPQCLYDTYQSLYEKDVFNFYVLSHAITFFCSESVHVTLSYLIIVV